MTNGQNLKIFIYQISVKRTAKIHDLLSMKPHQYQY